MLYSQLQRPSWKTRFILWTVSYETNEQKRMISGYSQKWLIIGNNLEYVFKYMCFGQCCCKLNQSWMVRVQYCIIIMNADTNTNSLMNFFYIQKTVHTQIQFLCTNIVSRESNPGKYNTSHYPLQYRGTAMLPTLLLMSLNSLIELIRSIVRFINDQ